MLSLLLWFYIFRVYWVYPNLNPNFWVPEHAGSGFLGLLSGNNSHYPNFWKPELPDPNFAGYPNAQSESPPHHHPGAHAPHCRPVFFVFYPLFLKIFINTPLIIRFQKMNPPFDAVVIGAKIKRLDASPIGAKLLAHVGIDAELTVTWQLARSQAWRHDHWCQDRQRRAPVFKLVVTIWPC
jgi:hypothetical protein